MEPELTDFTWFDKEGNIVGTSGPYSTPYKYIVLDELGRPRISGTRIKVQHLAVAHTQHGWNARELQEQFPDLTLSQIHSAFAYYFDHQAEVDRQIDEDEAWIEQLGSKESPGLKQQLLQRVNPSS